LLTQHIVADAARTAGIEAPARFVEATGSTNSDLMAQGAVGAPAWTVLVAGHQEAGRGRLGREWHSSPGQSLLVSVLLRPQLPPDRAPLLSLAAAVAASQACRRAVALDVRCRWPNDLMAGEKKLGGVLPEASVRNGALEFVVIGLGLNVSQRAKDFPEDLRDATSVALEGGRVDPAALLQAFLTDLRDEVRALGDRTVSRYRDVCATLGRRVRATLAGGATLEGQALEIGDNGELFVDTPSGVLRVGFGEIVHLD
jgi:BirA family transcriptional regulator, biotin operon repressor / biotin---[acetyl-CoA-carboxylase] ligase